MCGTLNKNKSNAVEESKMERELTPIVFAVNREYQIMMYVEDPSLMWVQVGDHTFYDESNGILRSNVKIHRVNVPMELLDQGNTYYTFRIGSVWGMFLDCGEDKLDSHEEYGGTVCFHRFRERETAFIKDVIARSGEE